MSLAGGLLFMIWVSIVFVAIGGWVMMTLTKQEKSLYDNPWDIDTDIELTEEDKDNILWKGVSNDDIKKLLFKTLVYRCKNAKANNKIKKIQ